ncbi:hypothetical protein VST7929_01500 [Vibrio stylophorae]|uniref:Uncharacterized protein n=2 Tax=Vibrio stylophorae TaxID=659351 RepID=A0ABM8ZTY6_9VIBR|nr:hypothetical protein VST7929_01500 [Vibrio stylophorae]
MEKRIIAAALLAALYGCGGGDSGSDSTPSVKQNQYIVIDGYLGAAQVYIDRNGDRIADSNEYLGLTDENGKIWVDAADGQFDTIVKVIAGQTTDSDIQGAVNYNKVMIAEQGHFTVTPFSTLAKIKNMSLADLASELNVSVDDISQDYIAQGSVFAHALARSIQHLLPVEPTSDTSEISNLSEKSRRIAEYLQQVDPKLLSDMIIVIDETGRLQESTIDEVYGVAYNVSGLTVAWEQKDFSSLDYVDSIEPSQGFHPCYTQKWDDVVLVANCDSSKFITLDINTGQIKNESATLDNSNEADDLEWFIDGPYLGLFNLSQNKIVQYFDKSFMLVEPKPSELKYTASSTIALGERGAIKNGQKFVFPHYPSYDTYANQEHLEGEIAYYDETHANIVILDSSGGKTLHAAPSRADILSAVENKVSEVGDGLGITQDDMKITWLTGHSYIIRLDTDNSLVSNDYHYFYRNGAVTYLGQFYEGLWRIGLDSSTVTHYSTSRGVGLDRHEMRQFNLATGGLVGQWSNSMDALPAVLYSQKHYSDGIIATSDSYSTVILLK